MILTDNLDLNELVHSDPQLSELVEKFDWFMEISSGQTVPFEAFMIMGLPYVGLLIKENDRNAAAEIFEWILELSWRYQEKFEHDEIVMLFIKAVRVFLFAELWEISLDDTQ